MDFPGEYAKRKLYIPFRLRRCSISIPTSWHWICGPFSPSQSPVSTLLHVSSIHMHRRSFPIQTCDSSLNISLLHWYWFVHHLFPLLPGNGYLFQDDNAPVHRARSTKEYVARTRLKNISWPAKSPDLNVIENIWLYIKAKLEIRIHKINSNSDLFWEIFRIWQTILLTCIKLTNLYDSFPRRILNVITMKGHLTKY
jgi:hypothetical protein